MKTKRTERAHSDLIHDADQKANQAEEKNDFTMLAASNALCKKAKTLTEKDIPAMQKSVEELDVEFHLKHALKYFGTDMLLRL